MARFQSQSSASGRGRDAGGDIPTVIQWNCRSLKKKKADMILRWGLSHSGRKPALLCLQEVNGPVPRLPGYEGYGSPEDPGTPTRTAMYVDRTLTHTRLDTDPWCSSSASVTGCRLQLASKRTMVVFSVYLNPENTRNKSKRSPADLSFIPHFQKVYRSEEVLVCGDVNAQHIAWNYTKCSPHGRRILGDLDHYGLTLLNLPQAHTRLGQDRRQADTTPDLTWASRPSQFRWSLLEDPLGSYHLPIAITVKKDTTSTRRSNRLKRECKVTH
ncbi:hypothetical protein HPB48_016499 [Haemaphysalis longicornis]|uniref:Endonuclease/exonuclease/phosphatase domain-containing protein n=1 Tax=Haemaphysalis longicornis TaxID=44386 RepID=A0A9J6FKU7_HAELO|nr:hypothetical protein HPB48_016499 [Haemaphysalis longicornis]